MNSGFLVFPTRPSFLCTESRRAGEEASFGSTQDSKRLVPAQDVCPGSAGRPGAGCFLRPEQGVQSLRYLWSLPTCSLRHANCRPGDPTLCAGAQRGDTQNPEQHASDGGQGLSAPTFQLHMGAKAGKGTASSEMGAQWLGSS